MRKYFLTCAVALLATSTANATTDYAEVTAKATIEVANELSCTEMNWGTIIVKQNNEEFSVIFDGGSDSHDLISVSGNGEVTCSQSIGEVALDDEEFTLKNANADTISLIHVAQENYRITGDLLIPANVKPGVYTGSFTVTYTH